MEQTRLEARVSHFGFQFLRRLEVDPRANAEYIREGSRSKDAEEGVKAGLAVLRGRDHAWLTPPYDDTDTAAPTFWLYKVRFARVFQCDLGSL